ncbi:Fungal transcriptional regulatory protein, N-terminal [Penicillium camemberti]|uniref:Fungal transcriptional regulatory protein, N-terminal n=1 Tax=Penicillium camemberti (strain FM 013) TaxID=1429867 RepID=A0A0G4PNT9_PENC3|nr:Fungal transcriptional regulatory protein, N-terminal [Penicillium camemberti]
MSPAGVDHPTRPCDRCRHRKSRCIREPEKDNCTFCNLNGLECTFLHGPRPRKRRKSPSTTETKIKRHRSSLTPSTVGSVEEQTIVDPINSRLDGTLGLELHLHSEYIGPASYHEPELLDLRPSAMSLSGHERCYPRRVNQSTAFMTYPDKDSASEMQRITDLDRIEESIRPLGPTLVNLYFRIMHRTFPILDQGVFLEKYARSYREFSPPLLAAVYLVALDWKLFDRTLATAPRTPDAAALEDLAMRAMTDDLKRPKLSTLQAGLLLLQRMRSSHSTLPAQLLSLGQTLGIHIDCTGWKIPEWEKGLRRRLAWALYMQDKWGVLVHGRPSLIPAQIDEDEEDATEEENGDGGVDGAAGRAAFLQSIELTKIFSRIVSTFCSIGATKKGGLLERIGPSGAMSLAKPLAMELREWHAALPASLQLEPTPSLRLSTNGALHLSHMATELTIHRALLRVLTPDSAPSLRSAIRTAAHARLTSAMKLIESFQPEHIQSFWGFAAAAQVALVGAFAGLLWATSPQMDEAAGYVEQLEKLRWVLQVRASAAPFAREALRMLHEEVGDLAAVKAATLRDS